MLTVSNTQREVQAESTIPVELTWVHEGMF